MNRRAFLRGAVSALTIAGVPLGTSPLRTLSLIPLSDDLIRPSSVAARSGGFLVQADFAQEVVDALRSIRKVSA